VAHVCHRAVSRQYEGCRVLDAHPDPRVLAQGKFLQLGLNGAGVPIPSAV
jgi:hypothetical protein